MWECWPSPDITEGERRHVISCQIPSVRAAIGHVRAADRLRAETSGSIRVAGFSERATHVDEPVMDLWPSKTGYNQHAHGAVAYGVHAYLHKPTNANPSGEQVPAACITRRSSSKTGPTHPRGGKLCTLVVTSISMHAQPSEHHMLRQCRMLNSIYVWGMFCLKGSEDDSSTPDKTETRRTRQAAQSQL